MLAYTQSPQPNHTETTPKSNKRKYDNVTTGKEDLAFERQMFHPEQVRKYHRDEFVQGCKYENSRMLILEFF